jgi:HEAT repeat protein
LEPAQGINFAGREDIIRTFRQRIDAEPVLGPPDNRHLLLVGVGGIGKTSLLLRLQQEFLRAYPRLWKRAIYLNLTHYPEDAGGLLADLRDALPRPRKLQRRILTFFGLGPTATVGDLAAKLREDYLQSVSLTFPLPGWQVTPGVLLRPLPPREGMVKQLARALAELSVLTMEDGRPTLVLIDDVGAATDVLGGTELVYALSRLMETSVRAENRNLLVVYADRPERKGQLEHDFRVELFHPDYTRRLPVQSLTDEEARITVVSPAQEAGAHLSDRLASDLVKSAGLHPYFLQVACSHVWDHLAAENKLTDQPVELETDALVRIVTRGQAKLFEDFNSDEQYLLKVLARSARPMDAIEIKRMVQLEDKHDLIDVDSTLESLLKHKHRPITATRQRDDYAFTSALFRDYVRENQLTADEREVTALQAALDAGTLLVDWGITPPEEVPFTHGLLERAWKYRDRLRINDQLYDLLVTVDLLASDRPCTWAASPPAISRLIRMLGSIEPHRRQRAYSALMPIGEPAVEALITALQHEYWRTRASAASILGGIGHARAVDPLIQALRDDDASVRQEAAQALGRIGHPSAVDPLIEAVRDDDPSVRQDAAQALGRIGHPRALDTVSQAVRDDDPSVREKALVALMTLVGASALDPLIDALADDDPSVRTQMARLLGGVGGARAVDPLIEALRDNDPSVRQEAAEALGRIGHIRALDPLIEALRDDHPSVRQEAAQALGRIGHARARGPLTHALEDEEALVRHRALSALMALGSEVL